MKFHHACLGFCEFKVEAGDVTAFLNVCRTYGYTYVPIRREGKEGAEDALYFRCTLSVARRLAARAKELGLSLCVTRAGGIPVWMYRYRKRAGWAIGALIAAALLVLGSNTVWDIRIEGEGIVHIPAMREALDACGLSIGQWIPSLDTDAVESQLLRSDAGVAWVSVNIKGTVAYVQLRPLLTPTGEEEEESETVSNLVARCDGVIESVRLLSGQLAVKVGQVVRQGELLVSGVRDVGEYSAALTRAEGAVMARTEHTLVIEIPLHGEQKVYTEQKTQEKILFFFSKSIKIKKSTGNIQGNCDTIKRVEIFSLPDGTPLPIRVETLTCKTYRVEPYTLSPAQALSLAYEQLEQALTEATADAMLLSRTTVCETTDQVCRLRCTYTCVEDIAKEQIIPTE